MTSVISSSQLAPATRRSVDRQCPLLRFSQTRGPPKEFSAPTEEADAHRITYRHRAQRRRRKVKSTERSAARGRVRLLGLLRAKLETETGITGAGSPLR